MRNDLLYYLALSMIPGIGGVTAKKLIAYCGGAEAIFKEKAAALTRIPGVGEGIASAIRNNMAFDRAEKEILFMQAHGIKAVTFTERSYPYRLKQCDDGPILLFVKGDADLNAAKVVGVVGTRSITDYGRKKCREIVEGLKPHQPVIVSGLAYGVDSLAHKTALDNGLPTVAVLGHGLDRIYPPLHTSLARSIIKEGALITDFVSGTKPDRENFPKRNRIIAGVCDALVVIEAAVTGGALITASIANTYNRDVFAIPGRTTDAYSMGCNRLIKTLKANLIESVEDIEYAMNWSSLPGRKSTIQPLFVELEPEEEKMVEVLRNFKEANIDQITARSELSTGKASAVLLTLEFKEVVTQMPGKNFRLHEAYW